MFFFRFSLLLLIFFFVVHVSKLSCGCAPFANGRVFFQWFITLCLHHFVAPVTKPSTDWRNHRFVIIISYHSLWNREQKIVTRSRATVFVCVCVSILVINKNKLIKSDANPCNLALFHMPQLADMIQPSTWFITNWNISFCPIFLLLAHSCSACRLFTAACVSFTQYENYLHESVSEVFSPCAHSYFFFRFKFDAWILARPMYGGHLCVCVWGYLHVCASAKKCSANSTTCLFLFIRISAIFYRAAWLNDM